MPPVSCRLDAVSAAPNTCWPVPATPLLMTMAPLALSGLLTVTTPAGLAGASAMPVAALLCRVKALPLPARLMGALTVRLLPACKVSAKSVASPAVMALVTLRLLLACSVTSPPASKALTWAAVTLLNALPWSANSRLRSARSSPRVASPFRLAAAPISKSSGSNSSRPLRPSGALRSTLPANSKLPLDDTSTSPPSPPSGPPRTLAAPAKRVAWSDQTMTRPPSPCRVASACSVAPACTSTWLAAWLEYGSSVAAVLPCKSPPTRTLPPPAAPLASSLALLASNSLSPSTSTSPPRPVAALSARTWPLIWLMPLLPPSITTRPSCRRRPVARTTPSRLSTVSAKPLRARARSSALPARSSAPGSSARRAARLSLRRLKKISPSPSTSTCTAAAAARPTRPASTWPPTRTLGPTSATVPAGARMLPSICSAPVLALAPDNW